MKWSLVQFLGFLGDLRAQLPAARINILALGMGSRLIHWLLQRPLGAGTFGDVIFAAADVDRDTFLASIHEFAGKADRVTLYGWRDDKALMASKKANGHARAGDSTNAMLVAPGSDSVDANAVDDSLLSLGHGYLGDCRELLSQVAASSPPKSLKTD